MPLTDTARSMPAALRLTVRVAGAAALVAVFTVAAAGVWFFVVVYLGLVWGSDDVDESTLTGDAVVVVIYGLATTAALLPLVPGLVLAFRYATNRWPVGLHGPDAAARTRPATVKSDRDPDRARASGARCVDRALLVAGAVAIFAIFAIGAFIVWSVAAVSISVGQDTSAPLTVGEHLAVFWPAWTAAAVTAAPGLWLGYRHLRQSVD